VAYQRIGPFGSRTDPFNPAETPDPPDGAPLSAANLDAMDDALVDHELRISDIEQAPSGGGGSGDVVSVGGASPITSTGGANPVIGITDVTTSVRGAMTAADKQKLNGVQANATANATDAQLRDRSTHTGSQPITSVSGLQSELNGKASVGHTHEGSSGGYGANTQYHIRQASSGAAIQARPATSEVPAGHVTWLLFNRPGAAGGPSDVQPLDLVFNISGTAWA
jgi:hypothetical protein